MQTINLRLWTWLQTHGIRRIQSVPASSEHRLRWIRLVLGLTQMAFALTAVYAWAFEGFHWRAGIAATIASVAAGASRFLYAGRPDPRLETSLREAIGREHKD